jgi:hypothetical protein
MSEIDCILYPESFPFESDLDADRASESDSVDEPMETPFVKLVRFIHFKSIR